jgi:hypothetical protein
MIPRKKRSPPDTGETHEVRTHQGSHPSPSTNTLQSSLRNGKCAGYRFLGTDRLGRLDGLNVYHTTRVPTRRKHHGIMGRFELNPLRQSAF